MIYSYICTNIKCLYTYLCIYKIRYTTDSNICTYYVGNTYIIPIYYRLVSKTVRVCIPINSTLFVHLPPIRNLEYLHCNGLNNCLFTLNLNLQ